MTYIVNGIVNGAIYIIALYDWFNSWQHWRKCVFCQGEIDISSIADESIPEWIHGPRPRPTFRDSVEALR